MKRHISFALISVAMILCDCFSTYGQSRAIDSMEKRLAVSEKTFLTITNGSSLDEVRNKLGIAAWLEFTASIKRSDYTLICCVVCPDGNMDDVGDLWLLFRDGTLTKIMRPVSFPELRETYPYKGTTATRAKPWDIGQTPRLVRKAINAPALTQSQMLDYLKPYDGKGKQQKSMAEDMMFAGAVVLSGPKGWSNMHQESKQLENDYATNEVFLKLYDGCRASLGMSVEEVDALYGKPLQIFPTKNGQTTRIYGDNRELDVKPWLLFSCLAVVFNTHGNATAIYSGDFFSDDWEKPHDAEYRK